MFYYGPTLWGFNIIKDILGENGSDWLQRKREKREKYMSRERERERETERGIWVERGICMEGEK